MATNGSEEYCTQRQRNDNIPMGISVAPHMLKPITPSTVHVYVKQNEQTIIGFIPNSDDITDGRNQHYLFGIINSTYSKVIIIEIIKTNRISIRRLLVMETTTTL
jgi:hypothetical protein